MHKTRLNYWLDMVIALAFGLSALSGIAFLFMGTGGYHGGRNPAHLQTWLGLARGTWSDLHTLFGLVLIAGVLFHLVLHWKWVVCVTKEMFKPRPQESRPVEACPVHE